MATREPSQIFKTRPFFECFASCRSIDLNSFEAEANSGDGTVLFDNPYGVIDPDPLQLLPLWLQKRGRNWQVTNHFAALSCGQ